MRFLLLALLLNACASETKPAASPDFFHRIKEFNSIWTQQGQNGSLNLTDSQAAEWSYYTGDKCESDYSLTWFNDSGHGTITFSNTHSIAVGNLNCSVHDGTFEYVLTETNTLQLCPDANLVNCQEYK